MYWLWKNVVWWLARDKEQKKSKMTNVLLRLEDTPAGKMVEISKIR